MLQWLAIAVLLMLASCGNAMPATAQQGAGAPLRNPAPGTALFAGANLWNIGWQGRGEYFKEGVDFSRSTDPWRADLLEELTPYRVLRFMDWSDTNAADTIQSHFNTRVPKSASQQRLVAIEWQIDLCNRAGTDCWFNVHHNSRPEDWKALARLIKAQLKPDLRVYIEWSNEVWNDAFPQRQYARKSAEQLKLPGADAASAAYVYASVRLFDEFEQVFSADRARLVKVLAGQAAWTGPCEAQLDALDDPLVNPNHQRPDAYAIAPYLVGKSAQELRQSIPQVRQWTAEHLKCARRMKVPLVTYEAGSDSFSLGAKCPALQHDPAMRQLYVSYLRALGDTGLRGPFMQYTHSGSCWGLKERTGDPAAKSPKYQGLLDWLALHGN
ncbi:MAG: hypothetical protein ABW278_00015 [Steroidobacteraceae bacterium]